MKVRKCLIGIGLITLLTASTTTVALADVGGNKLCVLGNTCVVKGKIFREAKVTYHVKPSDGTKFVCFIKGTGKHHFEGKLRGEQGFSFSPHDVIAHKNPIRFDVNGKFTDPTNGGSIVLEKKKISIFTRTIGKGEVTCSKA